VEDGIPNTIPQNAVIHLALDATPFNARRANKLLRNGMPPTEDAKNKRGVECETPWANKSVGKITFHPIHFAWSAI